MAGLAETKQLHADAFLGRTDYIPLCVKVRNPDAPGISRWEMTMDPDRALVFGLENTRLSRKVRSDWVPCLTNYYQDVLIPSFFGAELFDARDCNPMPRPFVTDIRLLAGCRLEDLTARDELLQQAVNHFIYLRRHVPVGVEVLAPAVTSPLDYALNMRGADFLADMVEDPLVCEDFLMLLTELIVFQVRTFKRLAGEPDDSCTTARGLHFPGLRIACDSMVNLSPAMIRRFILPVLARLAKDFKRLLVHYCTLPAPSTHVLPVLMESPHVCGVDNWQGYRTFFAPDGEHLLQESLAICTDLPSDRLHEELREPFFSRVRRKGGRGLLVTVTVDGVGEGRRIYEQWQEWFGAS